MKYILKMLSVTFLFLIFTLGCIPKSSANKDEINGKWQLTKVQYEDDSSNFLDGGNVVVIEDTRIIEIFSNQSRKAYSYYRDNNILYVTSGDEIIEWKIQSLDSLNLHLKTPIGVYILKR
ncbi:MULTISPECIES: lipocalin family protein [unclassified Shewanella]|jgi:hypothetical protein|uniref:lipocalin family protein n=1 Tax=unclassified Shewanella TaxID=196818 RepID=UPI00137BA0A1|nr:MULTISPECIES: lipocalin family protein [unclassified Shewanella]MBB1364659.1 lipocalin family protein [Shewanella sp. SR44-4]QHS12954.1 hypothetical protein GUY17_07400 [Shewanella sp. Arc9-LZ]